MSLRWNSEYFCAMEHKDLQANAMALNNTGSYVLLAGRRYIAIRNLDDTESEYVSKFPRQSKYDVGNAEWNPTDHFSELCVISCNQKMEVLTWYPGALVQCHTLKAHTRVITDLNWHNSNPNILASCSVDTFINLWDLRDSRRPTLSLSAIAEASQVRWNYLNPYILATAHDGDLKLWDNRKGSAPFLYISAHLQKIHGLDWNPTVETQLTTSSQDGTVKFFDINAPKKAEYTLYSSAPVWRARHTPFGNGLITVVVPPLRRGENSLLLWNTANKTNPVHTFTGHRDVVLEFEWRKQKPGETDFQLVTWSRDQSLYVWRIEPYLQKLCGFELLDEGKDETEDIPEGVDVTAKLPSTKLNALQQEFSLMNVQIPNLDLIKMDVLKRTCTVRAKTAQYVVNVQVAFPTDYPNRVAPNFQIIQGSNVDEKTCGEIMKTLAHVAQQRVLKNRTCLEPCLRILVTALEQLPQDSNKLVFNNSTFIESANMLGSYNDAYIPFPKTSGAKFCSVSTLVCFGRNQIKRIGAKVESLTPRALSALGNVVGGARRDPNLSVSLFYYQRQRSRSKTHINGGSKGFRPCAVVYDTSGLFLINKQLAKQYILDGDVGTICKYNANVAAKVGRKDLVQAWTLAELAVSPQQAEEDVPFNPLGTQLMQSLIDYYASQSDIQMAAMLSCIFGKDNEQTTRKHSLKSLFSTQGGGSPYHTIPPADVVAEGWVFPLLRAVRSNSLDNLKIEEHLSTPQNHSGKLSAESSVHEYYKKAYAETLHRWNLLYSRAEVLKYMNAPMESHKGVEFVTECQHCFRPSKQANCVHCKKLSLNCVICHVSVRGCANCCVFCGHGGHTKHLDAWFARNTECPSGCGCECALMTAGVFRQH